MVKADVWQCRTFGSLVARPNSAPTHAAVRGDLLLHKEKVKVYAEGFRKPDQGGQCRVRAATLDVLKVLGRKFCALGQSFLAEVPILSKLPDALSEAFNREHDIRLEMTSPKRGVWIAVCAIERGAGQTTAQRAQARRAWCDG